MSVLQTCDKIFKKFNIPTELYPEIFKYIPVHSVITPNDIFISMKFYNYKDIYSSCCFLIQNIYHCDDNYCDNIIQKHNTIVCSDCLYIFCTDCIFITKCCGKFLCNTCLATCFSCDSIYCQNCIINGACNTHVNDSYQIE